VKCHRFKFFTKYFELRSNGREDVIQLQAEREKVRVRCMNKYQLKQSKLQFIKLSMVELQYCELVLRA
jgi:hypothetical protein